MLYANEIKNLKEVAEQSGKGVELYYDIWENAVYTHDKNRWFVTEFLRKNTEEEIVAAVNRMLNI